MRVVVDPWDPAYGTSADDAFVDSAAPVDVTVELAADVWRPLPGPAADVPVAICVVDGVRRIDARVWVDAEARAAGVADDTLGAEPGICASWAAGVVRCDGTASLVDSVVGRGLFSASAAAVDLITAHGVYERKAARSSAPDDLSLALQRAMTASEVAVATKARRDEGELLVVDGPLRDRQHLPDAIGMVKTHHTQYLPPEQRAVLAQLHPGERTPLFRIAGPWIRHAWYVRLPGGGAGPMAGVVRCECSADLAVSEAVRLAGWSAAVLPRYASEAHKDARAPQNLYPIAGLERVLRRRLGDARLLYRALRRAATS